MRNIKISKFALKHFERGSAGTKIIDFTPIEFEEIINNEMISNGAQTKIYQVIDGYASFCKLLVVKNFTKAKTGTLPIDISNHQYLRHGYFSRRDSELPVFSRWFELPISAPTAKYLILVLYDKVQMDKEATSEYEMKMAAGGIESIGLEPPVPFDGDWGVVAILGQMSPEEEPMKPETMLRNHMPIEYGGSGIEIPTMPEKPVELKYDTPASFKMAMHEYDEALIIYKDKKEKFFKTYQKSVDFWQNNATVK